MRSRVEYTFDRTGFAAIAEKSSVTTPGLPAKSGSRYVYSTLGAFLKSKLEANRAVRALIQRQRELANSPHPTERFRTLWIAALLDERLARCTDREIGELMVIVQERFGVFEVEMALCHHARLRLLRSRLKELLKA
jgi:hypothetical protein